MMIQADVTIRLKKGMADPEGANTLKALTLLGFKNVKHVESMKTFRITLETDDAKNVEDEISEMCRKLLANPVIQEYSIKIL